MDWTRWLTDETLEDYVNNPIIIKGVSAKYDIYISVRPTKLDKEER